MEELKNVKIDWKAILSEQIKELSQKYGENKVSEYYEPLIRMLSENKIPSRVVIRKGMVSAYGYILDSELSDDRKLGFIGFSKEENHSPEDLKIITGFFEEKCREKSSTLIIDGIFNNPFPGLMSELDYNAINRVKMIRDVDSNFKNISEDENMFQLSNFKVEDLNLFQEDQYSRETDSVLLLRKKGKNETFSYIYRGIYGKPIWEASLIIYMNGIAGICAITDGSQELSYRGTPLIVDFSVRSDLRGKGLGKRLMFQVLKKLHLLGHKDVQLWVSVENPAHEFYKKLGFRETEETETIHYKIIKN
ncbi:GNAT family N-acetyltransferase [Caldiplasma sukawensis]